MSIYLFEGRSSSLSSLEVLKMLDTFLENSDMRACLADIGEDMEVRLRKADGDLSSSIRGVPSLGDPPDI